MSTRNNTIRTIGTLMVTTLTVMVSTGATIIPMNMPSAYSQGTPTCEELEEANTNDKFYCREYQNEDGDTRTVVACGEDKEDDFKCNKVIKDGFGENINPATRDE
ncbi:MAG TPA: hypothetical protein VIX38_02930 [Nitrososphaeraceae archaeon]